MTAATSCSHAATTAHGAGARPPRSTGSAAGAAVSPPIAHISADLDPVDTHLAGYGISRQPCDRIYRTSVPRILDLLDRVGVRGTFFVLGRDAGSQVGLWREAVRRGHEIASHSLTHPIPFATLPAAAKERELRESRQRLEDAIGRPVVGFRAPGWDVDAATLDAIADSGYLYDASMLASPALLPGAALRFVLSGGRMRSVSPGRLARMAFAPRGPHRVGAGGRMWEFPVAVSPWLRIPFTHTLWYLAPAALCRRTHRAIRRSGTPLTYQFHAADLLDLDTDDIDPRLGRHPGMRLPLVRKTALLEGFLREVGATYDVCTYADAVARHATPGPGDASSGPVA